ncbi:MAG: hypothetical protein FWD87_09325 [Spirochaetaceae bacterium]|nr:hypothetical protein [Spirochaetaceae bacterium]
MKKILIFCVFIIILSSITVGADTIFVYVEKGDMVINNRISEDAIVWVTRFEDGIMDILFESGHIVFSNDSARNQIPDFRALDQLAKSGGAEILASIVLNFEIVDDAIVVSGEYKIYNLFTDDIIRASSHVFNDTLPQRRTLASIGEKLFLAGQMVGRQIRPTI